MSTTARGCSGGAQSTARGVGVARQCSLALICVLLVAACSNPAEDVGQVSTSTVGPTPSVSVAGKSPSTGVLYVQHGVTAEIASSGDVFTLVINGAERRTQWITGDTSGVTTTAELTDNWVRLGLDDPSPQAVLVPADYAADAVLLSISEPRWDEERRTLVYEGEQVDDPDPRLAGMVGDPADDPIGTYTSVTLLIHQPTATEVPSPTTSTTTTAPSTSTTATTSTTSTPTPSPPSTGQPPTTGPVPGAPTTRQPTSVPPTQTPLPTTVPPGPTVTRPPEGEPDIVADVTNLSVESVGGSSTTFTLRNIGSGVGSWSTAVPGVTGLSLAPSSGLLFPGSSTTVRVTYDGSGPNNDFAANIILTTASGRTVIQIKVYPPPSPP